MDLMKLMMIDYKVETINDETREFFVKFHGPKDSPYQGGMWKVRVELRDAYPYKSPSIGFAKRFTTLMLMRYLVNVFEVFLPQLLMYPNPEDPLNGEVAALLMKDRTAFEQRVKGSAFPDFYPLDHMLAFIGRHKFVISNFKRFIPTLE